MKTSFVISTSSTKFSAISYSPEFEKGIREIARLGFDGIELGVRDPKEVDVAFINRIIRESGLELCAVGTGQAYCEENLSFSDSDESIRKLAVQRIKEQIEFCSEFSALLIIGLIRGKICENVEKTRVLEHVKHSLIECSAFAKEKNVKIVVEPLNRYETNILNTIKETVTFIRNAGIDNTGILIDTFHMNIEEVSLVDSIKKHKELIWHVHVADSNRMAPGCGHLNFEEIISILEEIGYQGYLSAEILPLPNPQEAARMAITTIKKKVKA